MPVQLLLLLLLLLPQQPHRRPGRGRAEAAAHPALRFAYGRASSVAPPQRGCGVLSRAPRRTRARRRRFARAGRDGVSGNHHVASCWGAAGQRGWHATRPARGCSRRRHVSNGSCVAMAACSGSLRRSLTLVLLAVAMQCRCEGVALSVRRSTKSFDCPACRSDRKETNPTYGGTGPNNRPVEQKCCGYLVGYEIWNAFFARATAKK